MKIIKGYVVAYGYNWYEMLDIEDDMTSEEISALVDELAADLIFRDGEEFDDVEWEVM